MKFPGTNNLSDESELGILKEQTLSLSFTI
jgi:hypothetical protein